ncbi:MAG: aromatic ring-hydroxylating dioxygenase subunit alpha, partial [Pseudomonadota bacterium]
MENAKSDLPHIQLFARLQDETRRNAAMLAPVRKYAPVDYYLDKELFERERREVFDQYPVMLAPVSALVRPGDFLTHDDLGKPLVVVRGHDDRIRVFLNVCRHRGMRLAIDETGRKPAFVCSYHHWTYDLDGTLKNVPLREVFDEEDLTCRNLVEVESAVRHGFVWVRLEGDGPIDLDAHLGSLNEDFSAFALHEQFFYKRARSVKKTNWKLIVEAFQDGYHVTRLHNKSVGPMFMDSRAAMDRDGLNLRAAVARATFPETLDRSAGAFDERQFVSFAYYVFPNTILVFHPDYVSQLSLYPTSVDETVVTHTCLIPKPIETEKEAAHWERA